MNLDKIGLKHFSQKTKLAKDLKSVARIFSEHKTGWDLITEDGHLNGILMNSLRKKMNSDELPKVGDWVIYEKLQAEDKAKILKVLPRYSSLVRHLEKKRTTQTIATNIDIMFVVLSVDQIFNPLQLNRYLTIALEGNIEPVVVINKVDLNSDAKKITNEIHSIHPRLKIITTSAHKKKGLIDLENLIKPGFSAVLCGNSGVGKSSLINALLAQAIQSTKEVSQKGKGQHTTTSRQVFVLNNGGIVIDTPGMRTLELDPNKQSNTSIFSELTNLSLQCKFRNCDHIKSAGCAIQNALQKKLITAEQLDQFLNLSTKHARKISYNKSRN